MRRKHVTTLRKRLEHMERHATLKTFMRALKARRMFKRVLPL